MVVPIPAEFEEFVTRQVASGRYSRPDEVLGDALALLRDEADLHDAIQAGVEQIEQGEIVDGVTAHRELRAYAATLCQPDA